MWKVYHKIIIGQVILNVNFADKTFMKKGFVLLLIIFISFPIFAYNFELPEELKGKWESKDRIISFTDDQAGDLPQLVMSLKTYYGLYNDRVAEPEEYAERNPRTRNIATHKDAEHIPFEISPLIVNGESVDNAWSIKMIYSKHEISYVPVVLVNQELYFNFYVRVNNHCYAQFGSSDGIKISKIDDKENIACLLFVNGEDVGEEFGKGTKVFDVRYWKSEMDYSDESAYFVWNEKEYFVPKHILSGVQNYSCTSGRANKIRNPMPPVSHEYSDFTFVQNNQIAVKKNTAILKKVGE